MTPAQPPVTIEWRRFDELSAPLLYEMLRFRQAIFVVEQKSPYADLDGLDLAARHLMLRAAGELVGYLRLVPPEGSSPGVRIGRVAVAPARRGRGLGRKLMADALRLCEEAYVGHAIRLSAQRRLARFYESLGFVATGEAYDDVGISHIDMAREANP